MNEPKRWLEASDTPSQVRDLLEAIPQTAGLPADLKTGLAPRIETLAKTPPPSPLAMVSGGLVTTLIVVTLGGLGLALWGQGQPSEGPELAPMAVTAQPAFASTRLVPRPAAVPPRPAPSAERPPRSAVRVPPTTSAPAPSTTFAAELALLNRARRALRSEPAEAQRWALRHRERFPDGQLADLRDYVLLQVRAAQGDADLATGVARFMGNYPESALRREVERLGRGE